MSQGQFVGINGLHMYYEMFHASLPAILPGTTHYDIIDSPLFAAATLAFLDQK